MALTVDSEMASNIGFGASTAVSPLTSPQTFAFVNTAGTLMYIGIIWGNGSTTTVTPGTVSFNGVSATKISEYTTEGGTTNGGRAAIYRLQSPATGSNTVSIAWTDNLGPGQNQSLEVAVITFTGENVATPEVQTILNSSTSSASGTSGNFASVAAGNITLVLFGGGEAFSSPNKTTSALRNLNNSTASGNMLLTRSNSTGVYAHTATLAAADRFVTIGIEVAASGATAALPPPLRTRLQAVNTASGW